MGRARGPAGVTVRGSHLLGSETRSAPVTLRTQQPSPQSPSTVGTVSGMSQSAESTSLQLIEEFPSRDFLRGLFFLLFRREPLLTDDGAYVQELESGAMSPRQLVEWLVSSAEWSHLAPMTEWGASLHYGRGVFIRSLPPRQADPRHRWGVDGRSCRGPGHDGLSVQLRGAGHRRPPHRGASSLLPRRIAPDVGHLFPWPRVVPLSLHDRLGWPAQRIVRPRLQRSKHRACDAPGGRRRPDPYPASSSPPMVASPSTPPTAG